MACGFRGSLYAQLRRSFCGYFSGMDGKLAWCSIAFPFFMRTILDISNDINFHLSKLRELSAEVVSVHTTANENTDFKGNHSLPKTVRKRRTRTELKLLIEAAVDTFGAETTDKLIAEKCGIAIAMIYREPYATYLTEAQKEYKKKQNIKQNANFKKTEYKDTLTTRPTYD
ncbi:MAG: hypothetical protein LBE18_11560 [Planctomycetaceae bacterium]|jgi:hypothetical protein|nr:hypothetical protein [Planctomycetaceae bacterium]